VRGGLWELLRPPLTGVAAVVLTAIGAATISGQTDVWRNTVEVRDAQDFGIFLTSVHHVMAGRSLYTPTVYPAAATYRRARRAHAITGPVTGPPNLNLPHTHLFLLPLAGMPPRAALRIWTAASFVVFAWAAWRSIRTLEWRLPLLGWLTLAVHLLAWGPAAAFSLTAQVSLLLMGPVTAAWLAARSGRSARAGGWLGVAAAIKPFLLLFVPYFLIRRDWVALRALAIATALMVGIGLIVFGPGAYKEWAMQLPKVSWGGHYLNASIFSVTERLFGKSAYGQIARHPELAASLALAACAVVGTITLRRVRRIPSSIAAIDREWAGLLLGSLLLSPLGWVYYVWIALWPVAATIGHARPWRRRRSVDLLLIPGLAGWLWFGKMTEWGQPNALATATFASMYFWALLSLWLWVSINRANTECETR
jgi:alpha-1,2-mannosyltransferase